MLHLKLLPSVVFVFPNHCLQQGFLWCSNDVSILKKISTENSLEGLMLKLKLQDFGHLMGRTDSLQKTLMLGKIEGQEEKGTTEDEMVGWHHQLDRHEFEQAPEVGEGQESQCTAVLGVAKCCTRLSIRTELSEMFFFQIPTWLGHLVQDLY